MVYIYNIYSLLGEMEAYFVKPEACLVYSNCFRKSVCLYLSTIDFKLFANEIDQSTHVIQIHMIFVTCAIVEKSRQFGSHVWIDQFHSQAI